MTDRSVELHLKSVDLYESLIHMAFVVPERHTLGDIRGILDRIYNLGMVAGRRSALDGDPGFADYDRMIEDWMKIVNGEQA